MELLTGKEAAERVRGMIQAKYQIHRYSVDLTVQNIYSVDPIGQVDFGGSEFIAAGKVAVATRRRGPEDKYGWWDLVPGCYFVGFNETLELGESEIALLEPDVRLVRAGADHVPTFLRGTVAPIEALLHVHAVRLQVKQNARISQVRLFRLGAPATAAARRKPARSRKASRQG